MDIQRGSILKRISAAILDLILVTILATGFSYLIGLISGGSMLGLSTIKKLESNKKIFQVIGVLLTGIGLIFASLFADANLYPEDEKEEE